MTSENAALEVLLDKVTRIELIDERGRVYVRHQAELQPSLQDEGRTLKLFVAARSPDRRFFRLALGRAGHE